MEGQEVLGDLREGIVGPHGFGCAHAVDVVADERPVGADDGGLPPCAKRTPTSACSGWPAR